MTKYPMYQDVRRERAKKLTKEVMKKVAKTKKEEFDRSNCDN